MNFKKGGQQSVKLQNDCNMQSKRQSWKNDHYGKSRCRSCNARQESIAHRRRPAGRFNHLSRLAEYG